MREWVAETTLWLYSILLPLAQVAFAIVVFVLLPMVAFRKTRGYGGLGLFIASYLFGATTWLLGCAVTFISFGWLGLVLGLFLLGIGVVPLGICGAFFKMDINELGWSLVAMLVVTIVTRLGGGAAMAKAGEYQAKPV